MRPSSNFFLQIIFSVAWLYRGSYAVQVIDRGQLWAHPHPNSEGSQGFLQAGDVPVLDFNDDASWAAVPNCSFYKKHAGSCNTQAVDSPCRYCREKSVRGFGTPKCPDESSFHPNDLGKKHWVLKPTYRKHKTKKEYICAVENAPAGLENENTNFDVNALPVVTSNDSSNSNTLLFAAIGGGFALIVILVVVVVVMRRSDDE